MQGETNVNKDYAGVWQAHIPDIAWGTLILFAGIVMGYVLTIGSVMAGELSYLAAIPICSFLAYASFTVLHDAGHGSIVRMGSRLKPVEDILGWITCVPLLVVPYRFFQKIHDRHHAFTNDPERDPDHFGFLKWAHDHDSSGNKTDRGSWYLVPLNCLFIPFQYHILSVTKLRHIKHFRDTYPSTILYFSVIAIALTSLLVMGYGKELLFLWVVPNIIAVFFLAMFFDYIPHHPHKSLDRYHNTRIFPGWLANMLLLGQNYHLIHHMYPRLPWYKYQAVYKEVLPDLEAHNAPIEDLISGTRHRFMKSPDTAGIHYDNRYVNGLLKVKKIERLTADAVAISFALPEQSELRYRAGQYVTVSKWLNGAQQSRCYSLCSSAGQNELKVGVRHISPGLMSRYLNEELRVGDELIVEGPFGDFVYPADNGRATSQLTLVAAGSGITPIMAILETALQDEAVASIRLIYANRDHESIMFRDRLEHLKQSHPNKLAVTHVISTPENTARQAAKDAGVVYGRLNKNLLKNLVAEDMGHEGDCYVCGPEDFKTMVVETMREQSFDSTRIHTEQFSAPASEPIGPLHQVAINLNDGQLHSLLVASNQTVLEVAQASGVSLPHACGTGNCGTCKLKVQAGQTESIPASIPGITEEEKSAGYTLACQCKPKGALSLHEFER